MIAAQSMPDLRQSFGSNDMDETDTLTAVARAIGASRQYVGHAVTILEFGTVIGNFLFREGLRVAARFRARAAMMTEGRPATCRH